MAWTSDIYLQSRWNPGFIFRALCPPVSREFYLFFFFILIFILMCQVHGTMIPPQPDRPNTPPLHLMPPDQPYAKDLAASAYNVDVGAPSEPSSEDDEDHDHIIRQFGKPSTASSFTSAKPAKPTVKPSTQEEGNTLAHFI